MATMNDVLRGDDPTPYEDEREWTNDAENAPTDEELAEWARMLMEEDDEEC